MTVRPLPLAVSFLVAVAFWAGIAALVWSL
jgi:hypothetical protein